MAQPYMSSRSPPPLQHPKPTHPAYPPPEPPQTPGRSSTSSISGRMSQDMGDGYVRYSSPPVGAAPAHQQHQHQQHMSQQHQQQHAGASASASGYAPAGGMGPSGGVHARGYSNQAPPVGYGQQQNFAWPGVDQATAQMGMQFGKSAVAAGQDYVEKNISRYLPLPMVKTCFSVTNSYVLRKLRLVLFPWRHRPWSRQVRRAAENGGVDQYQPPRDDINAPDLYIPTMAVVTWVLLAALAAGLQSRFNPQMLGGYLGTAVVVVFIEFALIKLGFYFIDVKGGGASAVEMLGYGGYKFVGIISTVIVSLLNLGKVVTGVTFIYTFSAYAFFLLRSLKYVLLPDSSTSTTAATLSPTQRSRRVQFLFIVAMAQFLWMGLLARV